MDNVEQIVLKFQKEYTKFSTVFEKYKNNEITEGMFRLSVSFILMNATYFQLDGDCSDLVEASNLEKDNSL